MLLHILQIIGMILISYVWYVPIYWCIKEKRILWDMIGDSFFVTIMFLTCYLQATR